jgi:hypothetical protein
MGLIRQIRRIPIGLIRRIRRIPEPVPVALGYASHFGLGWFAALSKATPLDKARNCTTGIRSWSV